MDPMRSSRLHCRYMTDGISRSWRGCHCIYDARKLDPEIKTWVDIPSNPYGYGPYLTINGFQKMGTGIKWPNARRSMRVSGELKRELL